VIARRAVNAGGVADVVTPPAGVDAVPGGVELGGGMFTVRTRPPVIWLKFAASTYLNGKLTAR